jgi:hypothetical protein
MDNNRQNFIEAENKAFVFFKAAQASGFIRSGQTEKN